MDSHSSTSISAPVATPLLSQTRTHLNLIPRQAQAHEPEVTQACLAKHAYVSIKTGEQPFEMFLYMGRGEALLFRESAAMSALAAQPAAEEAFLKKRNERHQRPELVWPQGVFLDDRVERNLNRRL